jgi:hypothetical protein
MLDRLTPLKVTGLFLRDELPSHSSLLFSVIFQFLPDFLAQSRSFVMFLEALVQTAVTRKFLLCAAVTAVVCLGVREASAQYPSRTAGGNGGGNGGWNNGGTSFRPGNYNQVLGNSIQHNPTTNSTYIPGVGVAKPSGVYRPMGNGYYRNPNSGNVYNPSTGSYTVNRNIEFRGGNYNQVLGNSIQHNPTTNSTYIPGVGVSKSSGVYRPIGNGYYKNPNTGNIYNPKTGAYISR